MADGLSWLAPGTAGHAPRMILDEIRRLLDDAFDGDFSYDDWEHALGGCHVVVEDCGATSNASATPPRHTHDVPRTQRWTDQDLIDAVDVSINFKQVCDRLGLWPGGGTYRTLERHMKRLNLEITHLDRRERSERRTRRRWTDEVLAAAVRESVSVSEVCRRLGYATSGGVHRLIRGHIARLGLETSHFRGQSWARGRSVDGLRKRPLSEILVNGSNCRSSTLRKRLIAEGLKHAREICGITEWRGQPVTLELDHVNGDHTDNRLENLRIVCPNCHAQTETWCRSHESPA